MNYLYKSALLSLLLTINPAQALEFNQLQPAQSTMTFGYRQMGVSMEGKFNRFAAKITFDPAKLSSAAAKIEVYLASIDTGLAEANEEVAGKKWFDVGAYPVARFTSTGIKALGGNRYQATGRLFIKGRTLDVTAPLTFQLDGHRGLFDGSFIIKRTAYAIGTGEWADLDTVADDIQIRFHLVVTASPAVNPVH
ncbi:MAG: YceI family protein [Gallionella sp.]|nr:YceI family protein [Gallionella sp.]